MKKEKNSLVLLIGFIVMIVFAGCNGSSTVSGQNNSFFAEGETYLITGEFDSIGTYGGGWGTYVVEVDEKRDNWIKVNILYSQGTAFSLRDIDRLKNEGAFEDIWINVDKVVFTMTEIDLEIIRSY